MVKILVFVLISELWITLGHICLKKGADLLDSNVVGIKAWIKNLIKAMFLSPAILIGVVAMLAGLFFWLVALKAGDLSVVYSLRSMQFIFVLLASYFFLGEKVDAMKIIGTLFITVGIIFIVIG
jgi:drug/metabolite transporter (DMT)-like permease